MRVLEMTGALDPNGITTWIKTLIEGSKGKDIAIDVCCNYRKTAGSLCDEFERIGVNIYHIPLDFNLIRYQRRVYKFLTEKKYSVVHDHRTYLSGATFRPAKKAGVGVRIAHIHNSVNEMEMVKDIGRRVYAALLKKWTLSYATHFWACSRAAMQAEFGREWEEKDPRLDIVYGGIDKRVPKPGSRMTIRSEFGIKAHQPVIGFMCRMTQSKNPLVAMETCIRALSAIPECHVLWVGDGPYLEPAKKAAAGTPVIDRIHFTGFRRDVPELLSAMDVYLQPSLWEGLPLGTLEALHAGLLVVGSTNPGLLESLPPNLQVYCSDANDVDGHVKNIMRLLSAKGNRETCPKEWLDKFTVASFADTVYAKYRNVIDNARAAGAGRDGRGR
jgi:glycosyltransferase involved in cell wall biosynthesis